MSNLNINFLISGKQFSNKLNEFTLNNSITNDTVTKQCAWSVKNSKSNNFYQIKEEIKKLKDLSK